MSVRLMTEAWRSNLPTGSKMVLLALCDNANDQGECYPSISMVAEKCSMTERSVFRHIDGLEKQGAVTRQNRVGRSTIYMLDPCKFVTPDNLSPLTQCHPTPDTVSPPPLTQCHPTPDTVSPITIIEPSLEPSGNHHLVSACAEKPKRQPAQRAASLPADFEPDAAAVAFAAQHGISLPEELAAFADHHTARGSRFRCWQAALRTWLRNSLRFAGGRQVAVGRERQGAAVARQPVNRQEALEQRNRSVADAWLRAEGGRP